MKIDGAKVYLTGRVRRRKDGALIAWHEGGDSLRLLVDVRSEESWGIDGRPGPPPKYSEFKAYEAWSALWQEWVNRVLASEAYGRRLTEIMQAQESEPFWFESQTCAYQGKIYTVDGDAIGGLERAELSLLVKHFVVSQQQRFKRLSREIQAFENLERMTHREVIPESVRIFVWQRDQGRCVECQCREALEFDHIIPVVEGGSSTERNVQLLCEGCNRKKGKNI